MRPNFLTSLTLGRQLRLRYCDGCVGDCVISVWNQRLIACLHKFIFPSGKSVDILSILTVPSYFFASFYDIKIQFGSFWAWLEGEVCLFWQLSCRSAKRKMKNCSLWAFCMCLSPSCWSRDNCLLPRKGKQVEEKPHVFIFYLFFFFFFNCSNSAQGLLAVLGVVQTHPQLRVCWSTFAQQKFNQFIKYLFFLLLMFGK